MKRNTKNAFTLVELLAVIVILAIILVIAVPKVMSVIEDSKKATLESTAKMIASSAEKQKVQNTVLGNTNAITCDSVAKINKGDYANCSVAFDNNTAKVTIQGSGKFDGLYVCYGTKNNSVAIEEECPVNFATDDWKKIVEAVQRGNYPYKVGDTKEVDLGTELGVHTLRVANTTPCDGTLASETACGFVLEFADIITTYNMNPAGEYYGTQYNYGTNLGGWPASAMRAYVNETIYNAIPETLRNEIIDTYVVSSHGNDDTGNIEDENAGVLEDGNYWSKDKIYLLSAKEVLGYEGTLASTIDGHIIYDSAATDAITRQLDYYSNNDGSTSNYSGVKYYGDSASWWWLRTAHVSGAIYFVSVTSSGGKGITMTSYARGVSPAFRIG